MAKHTALETLADLALDASTAAVKGTLFDNLPAANWRVPWHQDLTIAVDRRAELPGYGPWTVKAGVQNVQPPVSVLENIVALRVHLDRADALTGALHVLSGSHKLGRIGEAQIAEIVAERSSVLCAAAPGDVLVMSPLLLHKSSPGTAPSSRRVIHFEYACVELPTGLGWA